MPGGLFFNRFLWGLILVMALSFCSELHSAPENPPLRHARPMVENSVGMTFAFIPRGEFMMGSPSTERGRDEDETPHPVVLSAGFYLQTTEVTQSQWLAVMGSNPSFMKGAELPVHQVSWFDARRFIERLNRLENTDRYRLPREAEWEYACRGGSGEAFPTGSSLDASSGNFDGNHAYDQRSTGIFRRKLLPVGEFESNGFGLFDMSGNVWEWCEDGYGPFPTEPAIDPQGAREADYRVIRGGSWYYDVEACRCASRHRAKPEKRSYLIGFRVLMTDTEDRSQ